MLKRPRLPSPSPAHPDPSSLPPLESKVYLPSAKRRRTIGPILDRDERTDGAMIGHEDDYNEDYYSGEDVYSDGDTWATVQDIKDYEHVNHVLHGLHTEHQHRLTQVHQRLSFSHTNLQPSHSISLRQPHQQSRPSSNSLASSNPAGYVLSSHISSAWNSGPRNGRRPNQGDTLSLETTPVADSQSGAKEDVFDQERIFVTHRYEDTNRLLGSLVLSRRRILHSPPVEMD